MSTQNLYYLYLGLIWLTACYSYQLLGDMGKHNWITFYNNFFETCTEV